MEEHDHDPRGHDRGGNDPDPTGPDPTGQDLGDGGAGPDPWEEAGASWASLTGELRARYQELVGADGPTEDEIRRAVQTLGSAARGLVGSVGTAMANPEVREHVKEAASTLMHALTETFFGLADELKQAGAGDGGWQPRASPESEDSS